MIINYPCEFCMCAVLDLNNPNPWYCTKTGEYSGLRIGLFDYCTDEEKIDWFKQQFKEDML